SDGHNALKAVEDGERTQYKIRSGDTLQGLAQALQQGGSKEDIATIEKQLASDLHMSSVNSTLVAGQVLTSQQLKDIVLGSKTTVPASKKPVTPQKGTTTAATPKSTGGTASTDVQYDGLTIKTAGFSADQIGTLKDLLDTMKNDPDGSKLLKTIQGHS